MTVYCFTPVPSTASRDLTGRVEPTYLRLTKAAQAYSVRARRCRLGDPLAPTDKIAWVTTLRVYEKPSCTTCRNLRALLVKRGVDFTSVDYHVTGIAEAELRGLLEKLGCGPREILRMREPLVKELGLDDPAVSDDRLIAEMCANPVLIQRPIVLSDERALLARPIERVLELL
jgi:arsenate reductase (glutaredoxin)